MVFQVNQIREFGSFRLDPEKKILWAGGEPVDLPPKEIDLLCVLTESNDVVSKDELLDRVWGDSFVEESNLSRHIYRLRKVFEQYGEDHDLIRTVPRRGYRFTGRLNGAAESKTIVERHSISQTLIEDLTPPSEVSLAVATQSRPVFSGRRRVVVVGAAIALVVVGLLAAVIIYRRAQPVPIRNVAVLPLISVGEGSDPGLGLGFADALITSLGDLGQIRVMSASAVGQFAGDSPDPVEVGRKLGVDLVVDGSLQHAGGKRRVTLRMTRVSDGTRVWSTSIDEVVGDIFHLQDLIAKQTADALTEHLNLAHRELVLKRYTLNEDAYQAYQRGRYIFFQEEHSKAAAEFENALRSDPSYALAHAGLADALARIANASEQPRRRQDYERARQHALTALSLDPDLAEGHAALGWILRIHDWNWKGSEEHLRRAIELAPNEGLNHRLLAFLMITLGRTDEALIHAAQAKRLDPINMSDGWTQFCARRFDEAAAAYKELLETAASVDVRRTARLGLSMSYIELGNISEGVQLAEQGLLDPGENFALKVNYAIALHRSGSGEAAERQLVWLENKAAEASGRWVRLAYAYAVMGKNEAAIAALLEGLEDRDDRLMWIKVIPYFDGLRSDPRFRDIVSRMGL